jgi:4,5-DOPA dioxygenase extradiol
MNSRYRSKAAVVDMRNMDAPPYAWAVEFDEKIKKALLGQDNKVLLDCQNLTRSADLSIPTLDHYLPMIFAAAPRDQTNDLQFFHEGFQNRSVSMRGFKIG